MGPPPAYSGAFGNQTTRRGGAAAAEAPSNDLRQRFSQACKPKKPASQGARADVAEGLRVTDSSP